MKTFIETYNKNLLLIDNDIDFLQSLKKLLISKGFNNIFLARNCKEALNIIENLDDVYIIMEFYFKTMNGEELLKKIKKRLNGKMKVIVLSSSEKFSDSFKTLRLGALSFIHKTEDNWKIILEDSLENWINYYNQQDLMRSEYRQMVYQ